MRIFRSMTALLVGITILNITDGIFTSMHIQRWGLEVERNPLINHFILQYGLLPFTLLKIIVPILLCIYVYIRYNPREKTAKLTRIVIGAIFVFYSGVNVLHLFNFSLYFI